MKGVPAWKKVGNLCNRDVLEHVLIQSCWRKLILLPFIHKSGSLNCEAANVSMSWSISSIVLHLFSSKQNVFVCIYYTFCMYCLRYKHTGRSCRAQQIFHQVNKKWHLSIKSIPFEKNFSLHLSEVIFYLMSFTCCLKWCIKFFCQFWTMDRLMFLYCFLLDLHTYCK